MNNKGICYLVGAGPGDPGLITLKGRDCLRKADIIFMDHLASPAFLEYAREEAEVIYVGKEAGVHTVKQEDIEAKLVAEVKKGNIVTRLKGGDPFVFGRGGEEGIALKEAGLPFEVVPGVTAGIAGAAYAGIPVTHRAVATSVTFITGHETPDKEDTQNDWEALARLSGTLCFYMGVGNLPAIAQKLIACGRDAEEPVAVVRWATTTSHRTVTGTLSTIAEVVASSGIKPPALVVVGKVVELRESLNWFEKQPLFGKKVLVTRSRTQASELSRRLIALGAGAIEMPTISIQPIAPVFPDTLPARLKAGEGEAENYDSLTQALVRLKIKGDYNWVIFTSVNGVAHVWSRLAELGLDSRVFGAAQVAAIGSATADALKARGIVPDLVPACFVAESLFAELEGKFQDGDKFLLLRADIARKDLALLLAGAGAVVEEVTAYQNQPVKEISVAAKQALETGELDCVTFAASSTVINFSALMGDSLEKLLASDKRPYFVSIGPVTSKTMREQGIPVDKEACPHNIPGLIVAVCEVVK